MLVSALGFALMAACVKLVASQGIPLLEIVAARALVSLVISYIDVRRKGLSPWGTNRALLIARGAIGTLALICVYYAVTTLPLAEATLLQYMHPVFTALLGLLLLRAVDRALYSIEHHRPHRHGGTRHLHRCVASTALV